MKRIVLISCVSQKLTHRSKARDLYISSLFKKNLQYAETLCPDAIYVLSAKYGLVGMGEEIGTYDLTLNNMKSHEVKEWASGVLGQLGELADLRKDHFVFLAGEKYRKHIIPSLGSFEVPMEGLPIGKQLQFLKNAIERA